MITFDERSYGGQLFRPTPETFFEEDGSIGLIVTPWGPRAAAKKVLDLIKDHVQSARQDQEVTSAFQMLTSLSPLANAIRVGVLQANDVLYREDNKAEYVAGTEVLVFSRHNDELAFAQVGHPHLFLARQDWPWMPLGFQLDLANERSTRIDHLLPPLPHNLIGLHSTTNLQLASFKMQTGDKLIFLSHAFANLPLSQLSSERTNVESITQMLARAHANLPFWVGVLSF